MLIAASRTAMTATGSHRADSLGHQGHQCPEDDHLVSQRIEEGPRPGGPCLRASQPSIPSDIASNPPNTKVDQLAPHSMIGRSRTRVASSRSAVMPLAEMRSARPEGGRPGHRGPGLYRPSLIGACSSDRPQGRARVGAPGTLVQLGDQVRPIGTGDHQLDEGSHRARSGRWTIPSISGASRQVRPSPGVSTEHLHRRPDQRLPTAGRDGVLQFAALRSAFGRGFPGRLPVEPGGEGACLGAEGEAGPPSRAGRRRSTRGG